MSLKLRIVLTLVTLLTVLGGVMVWQRQVLFDTALRAEIEKADRHVVDLLTYQGKVSLLTEDYSELQYQIEGTLRNPHVLAVLLVDSHGIVVAASDAHALGRPLLPLLDSPDGYWRQQPILGSSGPLGSLAARFSDAELQAVLRQARKTGWITVALGALVIGLAGFLFGHLLTRRLQLLAQAAGQLSAGDEAVNVPESGQDEIGALSRVFNRMVERLNHQLAALRSSEERYRVVVEHGPSAMWVLDAEQFRFTDVNEKTARLFKLPRERLLRTTPSELSPPVQPNGVPTREYGAQLLARMLAGEAVVAPWTIRDAEGWDIPCELHAAKLPGTERTLICGSVTDIRDRERTERELAYRLEFENLVARLSAGFVKLGNTESDAGIAQALGEIGRFTGVDRCNVLLLSDGGTSFSCTHEWCAESIPPHRQRLQQMPAGEFRWLISRLLAGETVNIPDTAALPPEAAGLRASLERQGILSAVFVPLQTASSTIGFLCFDALRSQRQWSTEIEGLFLLFGEMVSNVLERRRTETTLRQHADALERSNVELQQFAYIASHDLQEPLRSISSFSTLLEQRYTERLDEKGRDYLRFVTTAAKRLHELINGLLDYTRVEARARPFEACALEDVLALCLGNLNTSILDTGARITHDPLPAVLGDPSQLMQLLQNLIGNAIKFHGDLAPSVHLSHQPARRRDEGWIFSVRDNGIGIAPEHVQRLFQLFRRLHTVDRYPGTGIGLALCKRIVERHNGSIWLETNAPAPGCTFYFTLPAIAPQADAPRARSA